MAYINCLLAGGSGGLGALALKKLFDIKYWIRMKRGGFHSVSSSLSYHIATQIFNPLSSFDVLVVCRGIIGGCIVVSAPAIYYKLWISAILGAVGGFVVVGSSQLF